MRYLKLLCFFFVCGQISFAQSFELLSAVSEVTNVEERPEKMTSDNEATIHFTLNGGLILLEAALASGTDNFILDTGAPNLFLNSSKIEHDDDAVEAIGITGRMMIEELTIPELRIANLIHKNIDGYKIDIQHLEDLKKCKLGGVIGQDLIRNHELFIDYENRVLKLLDPQSVELDEKMRLIEKIPFKMEGHFAILKVKIGKREYSLGIDTGAEANVLDKRLKRKLKKYYKRKGSVGINGLDKNKNSVIEVSVDHLSLGNYEMEKLPFVFTDLSTIQDAYQADIDGLLGFPFLQQFPFSINYEDQYFYIWEYGPSESEKEEFLMTHQR